MSSRRFGGPAILAVLLVLAAWWHFGAQESDVGFVGNCVSKP
eukprot:CAMPEP_0197647792 /NCGR_PEP_ID=MMETSP1338-20131121/26496_1 /TAXON_ID=43686 ORGANISM="Pelagodinium beii, Strain RCC1491" /NCGR_SAMPLE_ID=MMETSP1338 /ASSEMBLY_ACC=CAM_ASM_000754 /LENGTH=41 /DNA_ID= /DNA_START= /DNA_END= /DNA_ORIENTATION=